jgi:hypothetical protein
MSKAKGFVVLSAIASLFLFTGQIINPTGGGASIPNFTANGGLPHWQACRDQVKAGTVTQCNVIIIGESTSTGHGAFFNGTANDAHAGAAANAIARNLTAAGIFTETNTVVGDSSISPFGTYDTRVTVNGFTPSTGFFTLGANVWVNNDTTAFTFNPSDSTTFPSNPAVQTNSLDVYWIGGPSDAASMTVDIGGAPICTFSVTLPTEGINKTTCTTTPGPNVYNIKCTVAATESCNITAVHAYNSGAGRVTIFNAAADGATITNFGDTSFGSVGAVAAIEQNAPVLCIFMEWENDALVSPQTTIAAFNSAYAAVINACKASGDVLLTTGKPTGTAPSPITSQQYQQAIIAQATANNAPIWDSLTAYGAGNPSNFVAAFASGIPIGWNAGPQTGPSDADHWSVGSNGYDAGVLSQILMR